MVSAADEDGWAEAIVREFNLNMDWSRAQPGDIEAIAAKFRALMKGKG